MEPILKSIFESAVDGIIVIDGSRDHPGIQSGG